MLHDPPLEHDRHLVGEPGHEGKVVRDVEISQPVPPPQILQQADDLGLDRDIEPREGLIKDQQTRLHGQRAGDGQPLPLSTAELERPPIRARRGKTDRLHQLQRTAAPLAAVASAEHLKRLGDDVGRAQARVEGGGGVLQDELHPLTKGPQAPAVQRQDVGSFEPELPAGRLLQPREAAGQG
jgi:hypothetical protein